MEYPKVNTVFKRDEEGLIIPSEYTTPEFKYLENNRFECTEKIDGTNIRIEVKETTITFKGRTEKAVIPEHLLNFLQDSFTPEVVFKALGTTPEIGINPATTVTIFGEGYGAKIQRGGNYLGNKVGFILFDIRVDSWWLKREDCENIAIALGCPIVPIIGYMTLIEAIDFVKKGFKSTIAENKDYDAEGLVLRTPDGLRFRDGQRIIMKLKTCDFRKYKAKHPEDETVEL